MSAGTVGPGSGPDTLSALRSGRIQGREARLRAASDLLEGSFYQELFKAMRDTVPEGGELSGGFGEDVFEGLFDQHVAESAATQTADGIAEALFRHFAGYGAATPGDE